MKVAFISPFIYRYKRGIERFTLELSNELAKVDKKMTISILAWEGKNSLPNSVLSRRINIVKVPYARFFQSQVAALFYSFNFIKEKYDIINIFFVAYGEAEALLFSSLFRNQKFNIVLHYPYSLVPYRYKELKKYNLINKASKIISVSKFVADGLRNFCGLDSKVIYNGINPDYFISMPEAKEGLRLKLGFSLADKIILTVAALEERKGIKKVIQAIALLKDKINNLKYIILGEGPQRSELEELIREMRLEKEVFLLGAKDNINDFYYISDIFVLLSYGEAFGLALLEAMGYELPVIVPRRQPFDEAVKDDSGIFVDDNNPQEIKTAIARVLLDEDLGRELGEKARTVATEHFSWEKIAQQYKELFNSQI